MKYFVFLLMWYLLFFTGLELRAQSTRRVLFLGNSYTGVNDLPQIVYDVALSAGDTLVFDSYTPGGYQLVDHYADVNSQNKIMAGGWDYVVLQGQSQEPVVSTHQFMNGGLALSGFIKQYNPCAVTMPYMTWGRKNGDATNCGNFPAMCTYQSMDSALKKQYLALAASINSEVSPVAVVWNYLRQNFPNINLYQADESHPSTAGSYAAACCFYASIFKKNPNLITYNFGLPTNDATEIKNAVKILVFDSLQLWNYKKLPVSNFYFQIVSGLNQVTFSPMNQGVRQNYLWDFGDGDTSSSINPTHSYLTNGTYTVTLTTTTCDLQGVHTSFTDTVIQFCNHTPTIYTSHPWLCNYDTLWTQPANSYQWFANGLKLPETNQYLANYAQYNVFGLTVVSTVNGCAEISEANPQTPQWSGYYFDAIGNPCIGNIVHFAVLHINGFLSGFENILWYKNNQLLPSMTNEDTLLISGSGKYECKIINSNSICPLDTTAYSIEYNCSGVGIMENSPELYWTLFPNPTESNITIKFTKPILNETIQLFSVIGHLTMEKVVSGTTTINVADLSPGLYYICLKNNSRPPLIIIKQ